MRFLVFSTDLLPIHGIPTSGTALRTFGICRGLESYGHEVIVSVPKSALATYESRSAELNLNQEALVEIEKAKKFSFDEYNQQAIIGAVDPEVIICGHWPALMLRLKPSQVLIIDLAGPHLLERYYQGEKEFEAAVKVKLSALATADYFLVSGPSQRLYFLALMMRAGIDCPEQRIVTVTMPLSPELPSRQVMDAQTEPKFVFAGVFLPWQNPSWALESLSSELTKKKSGHLTLIGGPHPSYPIKSGLYEKLFSELKKSPQVTISPLLPFLDFIKLLQQSNIALDLMEWNLERQLAVTIRTTTYLWAGLPVIYNDFADLGLLIKKYNAGWLVGPGDINKLRNVLSEIYQKPEIVKEKAQNARILAQQEFSWDRAVKPLMQLLSKPEDAPFRDTDIAVDYPDNTDLLVAKDTRLEQIFLSRLNGLTRIECKVATHGYSCNNPLCFRVFAIDSKFDARPETLFEASRTLIKEFKIEKLEQWNNAWLALNFEPIRESAGKVFMLEFTAPHQDKSKAISLWGQRWSPFPLLALRYQDRLYNNMSICLRTKSSVV